MPRLSNSKMRRKKRIREIKRNKKMAKKAKDRIKRSVKGQAPEERDY